MVELVGSDEVISPLLGYTRYLTIRRFVNNKEWMTNVGLLSHLPVQHQRWSSMLGSVLVVSRQNALLDPLFSIRYTVEG